MADRLRYFKAGYLSFCTDDSSREVLALVVLMIASASFYACTYNRSAYHYILRADEGVALASAIRVTQGFIPQRDFPSYYGPFMPYVYGGVFKMFGPSIALMRGVWAILYIVSILLFYKIGRHLLPPLAAFIGAALLIGQQHTPLYTYNHIGFVLAAQGVLLVLFSGWSHQKQSHFRRKMAALLLTALLIKFNEAFAVFWAIALVLWIVNRLPEGKTQTKPPEVSMVVLPGALAFGIFALITAAFNVGLTKAQFLRNFPLLPGYQASIGGYQYVKLVLSIPFRTGWHGMTAQRWYFFWYENYAFAVLVSLAIGILFLLCAVRFLVSGKYRHALGQDAWKPMLLLTIAIGTYHEFYLTGNHWSTPMYIGFSLLAITFLIWQGLAHFPRMRLAVVSAMFLVCVVSNLYYVKIVYRDYSQFYINTPRARIYSSAESDAPVVAEVVAFLKNEVPRNASMAAFPHDSLLLYLAGNQNAMRDDDYQWMLFPSRESDLEIVKELETKQIQRILVSNFIGIRNGEPAIFGSDYLPETFKYLQSHYGLVKSFGANPEGYQVDYLELNALPETK